MPTLWMPACPDCRLPNPNFVFVPGADEGPQDVSRLYAHWSCGGCARRVYLPKSAWVKAGSLQP